MHGGQRDFSGWNGPEVISLDVVRLVGELRQVSGCGDRLGEHERRWPQFLVGIGVRSEGVGGERPQESSAHPSEQREHRTGHLGAALEIQDTECFTDLPVRHLLVLVEGWKRESLLKPRPPPSGLDVVGLRLPVGAVLSGEVRGDEQGRTDGLSCCFDVDAQATLFIADGAALLSERRGSHLVALLLGLTNSLGEGLHLLTEGLLTSEEGPVGDVEVDETVDGGTVHPTPGEARLDGVRIVTEQPDIEHGALNGSV